MRSSLLLRALVLTSAVFWASQAGSEQHEPTIEPVPAGERSVSDEPPVAPHIELADRYEVGQLISARFDGQTVAGAKSTFSWSSETCELEAVDGGQRVFIGAKPGQHTVTLSVSYSIQVYTPNPEAPTDPTKAILTTLPLPPYTYSERFTVGPEAPRPPPEPDPEPEPQPVPSGKRTVVILHESADQTPAESRLFNSLRAGSVAKYILEKGHALLIYDDDSVDQLNRPLKLVTDLMALGQQLPALYILDLNTGAVLHKQTLTPAANAAGVLEVLKANGG